MLEKRRYGRLSVNMPVILRHRGKFIPATMLNISCGGMYLCVEQSSISNDASVEVIFDLNEKERDVSMRGQITHIEDSNDHTRVGIQFTNIFSLSHKTVQQYVNKHLN
ncbi:MAG: PilZ domain-containing protein [Pseudomonadota bacterium]